MSAEAEGGAGIAVDRPAITTKVRLALSTPTTRIAAKVLISAGLLAVIFAKVGPAEPLRQIAGDWRPLAAVWLIQSVLPFLQAFRWRLIAAALGSKLGYAAAVRNIYIGQFFNQVLPSSIGGDAVRVWKAARFMPVERALSSIALDRIVALLTVPVILTIGAGMLLRLVPEGPLRWSLFALIAAAACGLILLLLADRLPLPAAMSGSRIVEVLLATPAAARRLLARPKSLLRAMALSVVMHLGIGTSLWILALGLGADAPLAAFLLLAPLVTMVTAIPISIGGWGVREGAMVTALGLAGIEASTALTVSIQFGLIMLVVGLPGGALTLLDSLRPNRFADQPVSEASR